MCIRDRDILNYVHGYKAGYIDYKEFNLFARIAHNQKYSYNDVKNSVKIIHFAGDKPWNVNAPTHVPTNPPKNLI